MPHVIPMCGIITAKIPMRNIIPMSNILHKNGSLFNKRAVLRYIKRKDSLFDVIPHTVGKGVCFLIEVLHHDEPVDCFFVGILRKELPSDLVGVGGKHVSVAEEITQIVFFRFRFFFTCAVGFF